MDHQTNGYRTVARAALGALLAGTLAGCGGGGTNTTPAAQPAASSVLTGTVRDAAGNALAGYQVVYDLNVLTDSAATLTVTTDGQGHYTITVPARDITGADTLSFVDTFGSVALTQPVTPSAGGTTPPLTTVITLAPPGPAPLASPK